jgi:hypothetical protein
MGCKSTTSVKPPKVDKKIQEQKEILEEKYASKIKDPICIDLSKNPSKEYASINLFGRPLFDPFEIVIFDKKSCKLTIESSIKDPTYFGYDYFSSYCNGKDKLIISGGDNNKMLSVIDLAAKKIEFSTELRSNRKAHSMIYVPNCYIFIVGGASSKSAEIFNINTKQFTEHSTLNEYRIEPALCLINDTYLYAFTGLKNTQSFERINLASNATLWETLMVSMQNTNPTTSAFNNATFSMGQSFYAVAHLRENEVIFLGGNDTIKKTTTSENNYIFNYEKNQLKLSDIPALNEEFSEKFFIPIKQDSSVSMLLPNFRKHNPKIKVFGKGKVNEINFVFES